MTTATSPSPTPNATHADALTEVRQASTRWIAAFNAGDVDACVAGYTHDAIMEARPIGRRIGRAEIDGFWRPFIADGAGDLVYRDVHLQAIDATTVELSASWSMNVGAGVITCERWVRQDDGQWRLMFDAFEIQQRFENTVKM
ncbi:MAG: nuclear transport factor 2 family protein [Myxococcota bacterium]